MKNQVLSIKQMRHLEKLGVDTSNASLAWWRQRDAVFDTEWRLGTKQGTGHGKWHKIPTFTLQDMLEMMPPHFYSFPFEDKERYVIHDMVIERLTGEWFIGYTHGIEKGKTLFYFQDDLLTCAYETLCWLAENKYIGGEK